MDTVNEEISKMETLRDKITKQAELFEVNVPEFLTLIQVRKDLKSIKVCKFSFSQKIFVYLKKI